VAQTVELFSKDVLDMVSLGKTPVEFSEENGDYIKVEVFNTSNQLLSTLYSNRILLSYGEADNTYVGSYYFKPGIGFIEGEDVKDGTNNILKPTKIGSDNIELDYTAQYKKQIQIFKDDTDRIYIKPNEMLKLLNLSKSKYKLKIYFLRNIKSTLGNFLLLNETNLIENGNFFAGLEANQTGDLDRSVGKNNFIQLENPGFSKYVLEQNGIPGNEYSMEVTGVTSNSNYIFSCWVAWDEKYNGGKQIVSFSHASSDGSVNSGVMQPLNTTSAGSFIPDFYDTVLESKRVGKNLWYRVFVFVSLDEKADMGTIRINLGKHTGTELNLISYQGNTVKLKSSMNPLGKRLFTDLRFEKIDSLDGEIIMKYLKNLKNNKIGYY
tara:strand:+ start:616 stop:1752 length:1137 start_codon:yes stop_codon:yes gene_type:complete